MGDDMWWDFLTKMADRFKRKELLKECADQNKLHPDLESIAQRIRWDMNELGHEVAIHQGVRTFEEQERLYDIGRIKDGKIVTHAKPGYSWHQYGLAIDMVFKVDGKWSWNDDLPWVLLGSTGKKYGLTWGGDFKKIKDRPHFEMHGNMIIEEALKLYKSGGLYAVWMELERRQL